MAPKVGSHTRSISLPSRSHPVTENLKEILNRLKASESLSTSSICQKLNSLEDLYECVDDMLQLSVVQQALANDRNDKCVENLLDGSLRVLDVCGSSKDILSQTKESLENFESSVRRKRETSLGNEIGNYIKSKKNISKLVCTIVRNLKEIEKKNSSELLDKSCDLLAVVSILREVEDITLSVFESVLSSISESKTRSKPGSWFSVSKLIRSKHIAGEEDVTLISLNSQKLSKSTSFEQLQTLLKPLEALESSIRDYEDGLERLYRCLAKSRVSLLNILSH